MAYRYPKYMLSTGHIHKELSNWIFLKILLTSMAGSWQEAAEGG